MLICMLVHLHSIALASNFHSMKQWRKKENQNGISTIEIWKLQPNRRARAHTAFCYTYTYAYAEWKQWNTRLSHRSVRSRSTNCTNFCTARSFMWRKLREEREQNWSTLSASKSKLSIIHIYTQITLTERIRWICMRCKYVAIFFVRCCCWWLLGAPWLNATATNVITFDACNCIWRAKRKRESERAWEGKKIESNALNINHMIGLTVNKW